MHKAHLDKHPPIAWVLAGATLLVFSIMVGQVWI